jgi:uncharacterized protein (DUF305 family)
MAAWRKELFADAKKAKSQHKMSMRGLEKSNGKAFDIEFADMMAKHHKDGVEMVRDFEGDLKNAQIKQFALNIATVQEKEIKELEQMEENLKK